MKRRTLLTLICVFLAIPAMGALYGGLDRSNNLSDLDSVSTALTNLGISEVDAVTAGTAAASKALVLDANSELNGIGVIKSVDKIITTAQVKALNGTPITVLAAVGSGVYAEFLGAYVLLDYAAAAYDDGAGEDLVFQNLSAGAAVSHSLDGTVLDGTADALVWAGPKAAEAAATTSLVANGGFEVTIESGEWITGDSPLKIRLYYRLIRGASMIAIE